MSSSPPVEVIAIAGALLLLALAIFFARAVRGTGQSQARRILVPTGFFIIGFILVFGLPLLAFLPASMLLQAVSQGFLWLALPAFLSAFVADGVAIVLGAERTPNWLAAGITGAIVLTYVWLGVLTGALFFRPEPMIVVPALLAAAAAITWWPYLPPPEGEPDEAAVEVFE